MKKLVKHFFRSLAFSASLTLVLHAAHPDVSHISGGGHDCAICQVATVSDVPSVEVAAPYFLVAETVLPDFVVLTPQRLALLSDPRGPPLA